MNNALAEDALQLGTDKAAQLTAEMDGEARTLARMSVHDAADELSEASEEIKNILTSVQGIRQHCWLLAQARRMRIKAEIYREIQINSIADLLTKYAKQLESACSPMSDCPASQAKGEQS
jgi:hypothetical protein